MGNCWTLPELKGKWKNEYARYWRSGLGCGFRWLTTFATTKY